MVYVLNKDGQPLMPTNKHGKVKYLLKDGKAKVVRRCPFTIKLLYETTNYTQNLTLGVDTGSGTIGAAVSDLMKNPSLANPEIRPWGYQKGTNYGFENTKAMVLNRDSYTCQCCKGKHKDSKLEVHHIIFRSQGGSDDESNLITLCHTCHQNLHKGIIKPKFEGKKC